MNSPEDIKNELSMEKLVVFIDIYWIKYFWDTLLPHKNREWEDSRARSLNLYGHCLRFWYLNKSSI